MDNLDQANQEIERLRKYADKLQAELQGNFSFFGDNLMSVKCHSLFYFSYYIVYHILPFL